MKFTEIDLQDGRQESGPKTPGRPSWLKEWLENQGKYVRLSCNCIEDLTLNPLIVQMKGKTLVECVRHGDMMPVIESVKRLRPQPIDPDPEGINPPF